MSNIQQANRQSPKGRKIERGPYHRLPPWARAALDEYVDDCTATGRFGQGHAGAVRSRVSRFLERCAGGGCRALGDVRVGDVVSYLVANREDRGCGDAERGMRAGNVRAFLTWAADRGLARRAAAEACKPCMLDVLGDIAPLTGAFPATPLDPDGFLAAARRAVWEGMSSEGYSGSHLSSVWRALVALFLSLDASGACYSAAFAEAWLERAREGDGEGWRARDYATALACFDARGGLGGRVPHARLPSLVPPPWASEAIGRWSDLLAREGLAASTVCSAGVAATRLALHADSAGASSWGDLDAGMVSGFCLSAPGVGRSTAQLYCRKARAFLKWLSESGETFGPIWLAVPVPASPPAAPPDVLSEADVAALAAYRGSASSWLEARDAAMVSLGLWAGLRASDVVALRLDALDWRSSTMSLAQAKTGRRLTLPMPAEAGNDVARYLLDYRPETASPLVFVKDRAPRDGLGPAACRDALDRALGRASGGFHVLRRTFATGMLAGGAPRGVVAEALGHRGESSVHRYLALDTGRMRACALPLSMLGGDR